MDALWLLFVLVAAVVVLMAVIGVFTGRLKRLRFGPDGVELESHDRIERSPLVVSEVSDRTVPAASSDEIQKTARWRDHVDANHDVYFGTLEQKIEALFELVSRGPSGMITSIRGVGGIGKTASAYEAVKMAANHYSMIAWASFRQHQNPRFLERGQSVGRSSREVLRDLAQQLGLNINTSDAVVVQQFIRAIRRLSETESALLVVDNLERLADVEDIVRNFTHNELLRSCHLVMTTRVSATRLSPAVNERVIGNLSLAPSCDLIRHEGRASPEVGSADDAVLKPIHTVVDGNPYLMKLVARRLYYQTRPLDQLLRDIQQLDRAGASSLPSAAIQDYMFTTSLKQLAEIAGEHNTRSLIHAFGSEPPGSRITHDALQELSELSDAAFHRTLDTAHELSLVTKHGLNESFSIHSLLHSYTSGWSTVDEQ